MSRRSFCCSVGRWKEQLNAGNVNRKASMREHLDDGKNDSEKFEERLDEVFHLTEVIGLRFVLQQTEGRSLIVPEELDSGGGPSSPIGRLSSFPVLPFNPGFSYSQDLQDTLLGKALIPDELPFSIERLHEHYMNGYISYAPGLHYDGRRYVCGRCGNDKQRLFASFSCARCGEDCTYCRKCIMMGRISMCTPLIRWCGPQKDEPTSHHRLVWEGELSPEQKEASEAVAATVEHARDFLLWAVCGAGKTEVLFQAIEKALTHGLKVCVASPRTDVVVELAPRFRAAFPDTEMAVLYGGSEDRGKRAPLVLATTHQLLRYREAFDWLVIDEVDAFPFDTDETLSYAVRKAKKPRASVIYLTATPAEEWRSRYEKGSMAGIKIPVRYHRHPLPGPVFRWCGNWRKLLKKRKLPVVVTDWLSARMDRNRRVFLFVPSIDVLEEVTALLQQWDDRIVGVHAEDEDRREKVVRFREGRVPVIVTTTILERGVTVPNVDVGVFGADDDVFTERALVQMAGRVGRSREAPDGDVMYFHYGKTKAMAAARSHIEMMNREGFSEGRR